MASKLVVISDDLPTPESMTNSEKILELVRILDRANRMADMDDDNEAEVEGQNEPTS